MSEDLNIDAQIAALSASIDDIRAQLRSLRAPYRVAREEVARLREQATPLVVALARAQVQQGDIADDLGVTRETIRRVEIKHGIDRGDPRAKPGSRTIEAGRNPEAEREIDQAWYSGTEAA
jgi:hypothetical protein